MAFFPVIPVDKFVSGQTIPEYRLFEPNRVIVGAPILSRRQAREVPLLLPLQNNGKGSLILISLSLKDENRPVRQTIAIIMPKGIDSHKCTCKEFSHFPNNCLIPSYIPGTATVPWFSSGNDLLKKRRFSACGKTSERR